ncbi:MAG TPA: ShlB/FhaC/HecB family hemolysin secretion/activation protein [Candidatus Eisenbacteria bacterium]|nr:ShlB/FhaC/HecB family hemolysin secretion/activation protein [Candidatus Eisenbacteria bacterium]
MPARGMRPAFLRLPFLRLPLLVLGALAFLASSAAAQTAVFGKNKVHYDSRDWHSIRTEHTEVFFYREEEGLAREAAAIAESTCAEYDTTFRLTLKDRIPILMYSSHQAFQQTNAAQGFISEGTGGLTELIKGRVLIPHTGSRSRLVWVTRHELTHAYQLAKLARISHDHKKYRYAIPPLWFTEGLAEFCGTTWDSNAEGLIQDAVLSGRALPLTHSEEITGTVQMYKEGQNFLLWLAERYSRDKIFDMFDNWYKAETFEQIVKMTFGESLADLDHEWFQELKRRYYPKIAERTWANEGAHQITGGESFDLAPAGVPVTPSDSSFRVVYLSAGESSADLVLGTMHNHHLVKERLLRGGFSAKFESFHFFRTRVGVSDGGRVAVVSQRGGRDVLHIFDLKTRQVIATWAPPGIVGLMSPSWLPGDSAVVITGQRPDGRIDLFRLNVADGIFRAITDDVYEEQDPSVNRDGRHVAFSSDRLGGEQGWHHLYDLDLSTGALTNLTSGKHNDREPVWSPDGKTIVFLSDRAGIDDLYLWREGRIRRLTSFIGPAYQPGWSGDGKSVVWSGESRLTFHIYGYPVSDSLLAGPEAVNPDSGWVKEPVDLDLELWPPIARALEPAEGYSRRFGLDIAQNGISLDPALGASGAGQIAFTDLLGDEAVYLFIANDSEDFGNFLSGFEFGTTYFNQKQRFNYGLGFFRLTRTYDTDLDVVRREPRVGGSALASYPLSKFTRVDGSFVLRFAQQHLLRDGTFADLWLASDFLSFVHDNSRWNWDGPIGGMRWNLSGGYTRDLSRGAGDYFTVTTDWRGYAEPVHMVIFASRFLGQSSFGDDAQNFYLGGRYSLRGWPTRILRGKNALLWQEELRFPLVRGLRLGFPTSWQFPNIQGAAFVDMGSAGDAHEQFHQLGTVGAGFYLGGGGYFPTLRWDFMRLHNGSKLGHDTVVEFTIGFLF